MITWAEYQGLARRTQNKTLSNEEKRMHALFGIGSEVGEVIDAVREAEYEFPRKADGEAAVKILKELGDVLWFAAELCDTYGFDLAEEVPAPDCDCLRFMVTGALPIETAACLSHDAGGIFSLYQHVYQGEEISEDVLRHNIRMITGMVAAVGYIYGFTLEHIADTNIRKLMKRYPDGYSDIRSIEREDR